MTSPDFPVGSIVYFLHNKTERVLPAQVTEKIVRTSQSGSRATYIIAVRSKDSIKNIEIDPEEVHVFQTPEQMKLFMIERATAAISRLVDVAVQASSVFENATIVEEDSSSASVVNETSDGLQSWHIPAAERPIKKKVTSTPEDSYTEVDLGDGTKARLKM